MIKLVIAILIFITSFTASALSFDEFIEAYQENSLALAQLQSEKQASFFSYREAISDLLPQLSFNMGYLDSESPAASRGLSFPGLTTLKSKNYSASLNVDQVIYAGGSILNNIQLKKTQYQLAEVSYQSHKQTMSQNVLFQALSWKFMAKNIEVLKASLAIQRRFLGLVKKRMNSGLAQNYDYDKTLGGKLSYELRIEQLQQSRDQFLDQLIIETGLSKDKLSQLTLPDIEKLTVGAPIADYNKNHQYKAVLAEQKIIDSQVLLERSKNRPSLGVGASLGRESIEFSGLKENVNDTKAIYVNLKVPLFTGFSAYQLRKKNKAVNFALKKKQDSILRNIRVQSGTIYERLKKNKVLVKKNRAWKVTAQRALERALRAYRLGQLENSQVVLMQSDFERASSSYLDLIHIYYKDYIAWQSIQGNNIEDIF